MSLQTRIDKDDNYLNRRIHLTINNKQLCVRAKIQATTPLLITDDESFQRFVYKTEQSLEQASYVIKGWKNENGTLDINRFIFITRVESYINRDIVDLYYDKKYQDIIIVPDLVYTKHLSPTEDINIFCQRIGGGYNVNDNTLTGLTISSDENCKITLPEARKISSASVYMAAIPGLQTPDYTQDANSYEEMLNDAINLKRYHRQMLSFLCLGTVSQLFGEVHRLPLYLLYQSGVRGFSFKYLNQVKPDANTKLYIPLNF